MVAEGDLCEIEPTAEIVSRGQPVFSVSPSPPFSGGDGETETAENGLATRDYSRDGCSSAIVTHRSTLCAIIGTSTPS